ncbi:hypothetical protein Pmani_038889 [Petrolisthes manimaculis]|uniref:Uncharacterized protein n=1 Tax=Petrolisthes manimaculis TaxID=1843537 RepID=A0AAE1NET1_9EUCA|nr:hypothetical protein Pmani_038889 [Petrolisthes manimaculis]
MSMGGANLRYGIIKDTVNRTTHTPSFECTESGTTEAVVILALGVLGMSANIYLWYYWSLGNILEDGHKVYYSTKL